MSDPSNETVCTVGADIRKITVICLQLTRLWAKEILRSLIMKKIFFQSILDLVPALLTVNKF